MQRTMGLWLLAGRKSDELVGEIMKTIRLSRAEASAMAVRMLITQLIMAADMPSALEETQGAA